MRIGRNGAQASHHVLQGGNLVNPNAADVQPENHPEPNMAKAEPPEAPAPANVCFQLARWWLIACGLAAGLLSFAIGEAIYQLIPARIVPIDTMGHISMGPSAETSRIADMQNGTLTFGLLGICLGGCLGIAGGLARRSVAAAIKAGLLGAVLAMILAVALSWLLLPFFLKELPNQPDYDVIFSMVMHGTIWGLIGASGGLAFAVGLGERKLIGRALLAGLGGAVLGAIVFDLIGASLFPLDDTIQPISITRTTRFLARIILAVATTGIVILSLPGSPKGVSDIGA